MTSGGIKSDQELNNLVMQIRNLQERLTQLETHALTSENIKANKIAVGGEAILDSISDGDIATIPLTPYHDISTIVGWSSFTEKIIYYKKTGDLIFIQYRLVGQSNDTVTSFTLPQPQNNLIGLLEVKRGMDNGTWQDYCYMNLSKNNSTVNFFSTKGGGAWTASGNKRIYGEFLYIAP